MTLQTASCWDRQFLWKHWIGGADLPANKGLNGLNREAAWVWRSTTSLISSRNESRQPPCAFETRRKLLSPSCATVGVKSEKNNKMKQYFIHNLITFIFQAVDNLHLCSFFCLFIYFFSSPVFAADHCLELHCTERDCHGNRGQVDYQNYHIVANHVNTWVSCGCSTSYWRSGTAGQLPNMVTLSVKAQYVKFTTYVCSRDADSARLFLNWQL